jgi:hypothetical protein
MTERTITESQLEKLLKDSKQETYWRYKVMEAAFPPIFKPKEGEVICVSEYKDFRFCSFRVFSRMNVNNGYDCFSDAAGSVAPNIIPWSYAKPQTPTQKGE